MTFKRKKKTDKDLATLDKQLTYRQSRFVEEYLRDGDAPRAALRAGYPRYKVYHVAEDMINNKRIQEAISERRAELAFAGKLTQDRIMAELSRIAFFNAKYLFDSKGNPLPISELPDSMTAAIEAVEVQTNPDGSVTSRAKFYNKLKALDILGKIIGTHGAFMEQQDDNERDKDEVYAMLKGLNKEELKALKEAYYRVKGVAVLEDKRKKG